MLSAHLAPIPDRPVLELTERGGERARTIVLADLHLGLGSTEASTSVPPDALARTMAWDLVGLGRERRARGFLVVGDVKHPIVGTPPSLRPVVFDFFSTLLGAGFRAEVVLGNHDVGLARWLPREVTVHPARGVVRSGVGFFHGHRWPSNPVLRADRLVVGHLHPGYRFAPTPDAPSTKQRCWVRVPLDPPRDPPKRRRRHGPVLARELVVLPAFNPIAGTEALNRERPARGRSFLVNRFLSKGPARAYLLDGTDVGDVLTRWRSAPTNAPAVRVPRRR
ncbi:MAG: hypothetical protein L3K06_00920 [Thermoplasmata archaeon]|nr:hypothetical protein [Thermoplasmata archaeon]MCI4353911.1 hypothetical protein [Thermoplasmata archaeon]